MLGGIISGALILIVVAIALVIGIIVAIVKRVA
jgi:hypothetical protein